MSNEYNFDNAALKPPPTANRYSRAGGAGRLGTASR